MAKKGKKPIIHNEMKKYREGRNDFFKSFYHLHETQQSLFFKPKKSKPYGY